jgi:hypothetical protein
MFAAMKAFKMKLKIFKGQLSKCEMCRFLSCAQSIPQRKHAELEVYAKQIGILIEETDRRLALSIEEDVQMKLI